MDYDQLSQCDIEVFYSALDRDRRIRGLSWKQVDEQVGVKSSTRIRMAQGVLPDAATMEAFATWLGRIPLKSPMDYEQLTQWRDLCEHLNSCWYKCEEPYDLERKLPNCQIWKPELRSHRQHLWDNWQLQLMDWGEHPVLRYVSSRANRKAFRKWRGWTLQTDWQVKIDFLEKVVLFDADPNQLEMPWVAAITKAREERDSWKTELERQRVEQERLRSLSKLERFNQGLCPWCAKPMIILMMDCNNCGRSYEDFN
jgi:hypothetical protein